MERCGSGHVEVPGGSERIGLGHAQVGIVLVMGSVAEYESADESRRNSHNKKRSYPLDFEGQNPIAQLPANFPCARVQRSDEYRTTCSAAPLGTTTIRLRLVRHRCLDRYWPHMELIHTHGHAKPVVRRAQNTKSTASSRVGHFKALVMNLNG